MNNLHVQRNNISYYHLVTLLSCCSRRRPLQGPGETVVHGLRAIGREKRETAKRPPAFRGEQRLKLETTSLKSAHNSPRSLTDTPPDKDQTYTDTRSIGQDLNHGGNRQLCLKCGDNAGKRRGSKSTRFRQITSLLFKIMGAGGGFEPPSPLDERGMLTTTLSRNI